MSVTVEKLAIQIGESSVEKLISQLEKAGIKGISSKEDLISKEHEAALLDYLKSLDGDETQTKPRRKISIKRKSLQEVRDTGGRTVTIVNKTRKTYVRQEDIVPEVTVSESDMAPKIASTETAAKPATATEGDKTNKDELDEQKKKNEPQTPKVDTPKVEDKEKPKTVEPAKDTSKDKKKTKSKKDLEEIEEKRKSPKVVADKATRKGKAKSKIFQEEMEDSSGSFRRRHKRKRHDEEVMTQAFVKPSEPKTYKVNIAETVTVSELAKQMSVKAAEVIKVMMKLGAMATINQVIDQDTACIIVEEMGHEPILVKDTSVEDAVSFINEGQIQNRPPVVTVMGHVDHGKTSLLDSIRRTKVIDSEAGGITQHIGAYQVQTSRGLLTFLDTPGHSAFTAMRARGASCTDIVILVVAADDGVMPQTIEAIQHSKAAGVPIIVAINKIDKPDADAERIINELSQYELIPESWGGDTIFCQVSAKEGMGIEELLEVLMLQAEVLELNAVATGPAQGVVIEARVDKGRGSVATLLVQQGQLKMGDMVLAGLEYGRIRAMIADDGGAISAAGPSVPVEVLGLSSAPNAGDIFQSVTDERKAREVALYRQGRHREVKLSKQQATKLEGFMDRMKNTDVKVLNIVLKADVQGSIEALADSLEKLSNAEIKVRVISKAVGGFNESDINLAIASEAILIGFNVRADASARKLSQLEDVEINYYSIIYDAINDIKGVLLGRLGPEVKEEILGLAEVKDVFRSSKIGAIAGCVVLEGKIKRGNPIRVLRNNVVVYAGELESLRRFKDIVDEVKSGTECGIGVKNYNDVKVGDQIEVFETVEIARKEL